MANFNDTINEAITDDNEILPLEPFFATLKENGFSVTPLQVIHAHKVVMQYAGWVNNENTLWMYLAPIFSGSEDEQLLFKKLFDKHFKSPASATEPVAQKPSIEATFKQHWKKFLVLYVFLALLVVWVIVQTLNSRVFVNPATIAISIREKKDSGITATEKLIFQTQTNTAMELVTAYSYAQQQTGVDAAIIYDWGDGSTPGALPSHIYITAGKYHLTVYVNLSYKNSSIKKDTLRRMVNVCSSGNTLTVKLPGHIDSILIGEKVQLEATVTGNNTPIAINWVLNERETASGKKIAGSFKKAGTQRIICRAIFDSINSPCTIEKYISFIVHDKADFLKPAVTADSFNVKPIENAVYNKERIQYLSSLYKKLGVAFSLLSIFFIGLWLKELKKTGRIKNKALDKYKKISSSFASIKKPAVLAFRNRNYIPVQQSELDDISKLLRRRVKDTVSFMHINKTINKAIERAGFFEPVKEPRTRQSEYLVLIDETNPDNQVIKLFEYLLVMLKKHNVLVEKFYYKKYPGFCYNIHEPQGISLEKLHGKYQRHILLIFGNGYQLIDNSTKAPGEKLAALLDHWQHKAIVTPVSFTDWQERERNILLPYIPIVPLDMEGLVLLAEMLAEKERMVDIVSRLNSHKGIFYSSTGIDFDNINELETYCTVTGWTKINEDGGKVNVLKEWVAALAIYPKLRWEITLAIGNAILDKYQLHRQLDFTILLRIMRIGWMQQGFINDRLRVELLKKLSLENERIARETILMLLKEIPQQEIQRPAELQEKEVQQLINEFTLYAHDPVFYSSYSESTYLFQKLWQDNQLKDDATTTYLKNENRQWNTLVNQLDPKNHRRYNIGTDEYLQTKEKEETLLGKVYLSLGLVSIAVLLTSVAAFRVLYIWDNVL